LNIILVGVHRNKEEKICRPLQYFCYSITTYAGVYSHKQVKSPSSNLTDPYCYYYYHHHHQYYMSLLLRCPEWFCYNISRW